MTVLALALGFVAALLQISLLPALNPWGGPDLLAVVVVSLLLQTGRTAALIAALLGGAILDTSSSLALGTLAVTYLLAAMIGEELRRRFNLTDRLPHLLTILLVVESVVILTLLLVLLLSGESSGALSGEIQRGVIGAALTLLFGTLLSAPLRSFQRFAALYQGLRR